MVDRGGCDFVTKVKNAESVLNAVAVVIADNLCLCGQPDCAGLAWPQCDAQLPFMADDGYGKTIQIPSYIISKYDAQQIKDCIAGRGTLCTGGSSQVQVKLSWDLPKPDDTVEWEMWTSSDDYSGVAFKCEF